MRTGFVAGDEKLIKPFLLYRTYHGSAMGGAVQHASIAAWNAAGRNGIAVGTELLVGWIIPLLCLTLMLGGLRGWLWLRANGIRRGF